MIRAMVMVGILSAPAWAQDGAAVWWKLDETSGTTSADSSGNSRTATYANGPVASSDVPQVRFTNVRSLGFDGIDDCDQLPNYPFTFVDSFTFSLWVKPTATVPDQPDTTQTNGGVTGTTNQRYAIFPTFGSWPASDSGSGISIGTNGIRVYEHAGNYMPAILIYNTDLSNQWTHVAVVYTSKTPTLYLNGVLVRTGVTSTRTAVHPGTTLGGSTAAYWNTYGKYGGLLDDARIYPRSLTPLEIRRLALGNQSVLPGTPPSAATNVKQLLAGVELPLGAWVSKSITLQADAQDATQQVMLEVQMRRVGTAWPATATASSPLQNSGTIAFNVTVPSTGDYEWRYRVGNSNLDYTPAEIGGVPQWTLFNAGSPHFRSDQDAPTVPVGVTPVDQDAPVAGSRSGAVTFTWVPSTDLNPNSGITYDVEVWSNATGTIETSASGVPTTSVGLTIIASNMQKFWHVRSRDSQGNTSAWSPLYTFRAVPTDGVDNGAGNAVKACGFGVTATAGPSMLILLAVVLAALRRRA